MKPQHAFEQFIIRFEGTANAYPEDFLAKSSNAYREYKDPEAERMFRMYCEAHHIGLTSGEVVQPTGLEITIEQASLKPTINGKDIPGLVSILQETKVKKNGRTEDYVVLKIKR